MQRFGPGHAHLQGAIETEAAADWELGGGSRNFLYQGFESACLYCGAAAFLFPFRLRGGGNPRPSDMWTSRSLGNPNNVSV